MNALFAPIYDEHWGARIDPSHQALMARFLAKCVPGCIVLDAACGTGKYWPLIQASGRTIVGIDQAQEMLNRAQAKFPTVPVRHVGLQELSEQHAFDAIICVDALENIAPEDRPTILHNFQRALKPNGLLYFTVELADPVETQAAFDKGRAMGFPVVYGEWAQEGGYHYYPSIPQVKRWIEEAQFVILDAAVGDDYHHFIVRERSAHC